MKHSVIFTFFFFIGVSSTFGQTLQTVTNNGATTTVKVELNNSLQVKDTIGVDSIIVNKGMTIKNSLKVDTLTVNRNMTLLNNLKINKDLGVDSIVVTKGVKINNSLTVDSINVRALNFGSNLNLKSGNLNLGDHKLGTGNANFTLRYNNGTGSIFAFIKGDGVNDINNVPDAAISKMAGSPFNFGTLNNEGIEFRTNANVVSTPRLTIAGNGNVGIGRSPSSTERLTIDGELKIIGTGAVNNTLPPKLELEGTNPVIHLNGDMATGFPAIQFSGNGPSGGPDTYRKVHSEISGASGSISLKTYGRLTSLAQGTDINTNHKALHQYFAQGWTGYAEISAKGLYSPSNFYSNSIDFVSGTRRMIATNQYTGGLLMGYSTSDAELSNLVAGTIKTQYMGSDINANNQRKFDMVFGVNTDGTGNFTFDPTERMRIQDNGTVKIGKGLTINTSLPLTGDTRLLVDGRIVSTNVTVALVANWPDYVFEKNYKLTPLSKVEEFVEKNGHLPNVPSAAEVKKDGIDLGTMNAKLLEKVEELTLHLINQQKQIDELKNEVKNFKKKN